MSKTRRFFFGLASSSVAALALLGGGNRICRFLGFH